uniref:Uncharacterized protein n=1 Tax=Acrobeloides nanus TaxID=290746 RepID=A0A914CK52_9BILA
MKRIKWLLLCTLFIVKASKMVNSMSITTSVSNPAFSFNTNSKFIYASVHIPSNSSRIFGVFEPNSSESNNAVFEIDYSLGREVLTFPVEQLPLSIGNATAYCADVNLSSGFDMEIEINEDYLIVRAKNSRKYILKKRLVPPEKFKILFFYLSLEEGPCLLPAIMSLTQTSTYSPQKHTSISQRASTRSYSQKSNNINTITKEYPYSAQSTTRRYVGRLNLTNFKAHRLPKTTTVAAPTPTSKKIKKDAPETRGGWTSEINSEWSLVFFLLFGTVLVMVVIFVLFGLIVFIYMQ